ncbi:hypothetical protein [Streptomyces sp. MZ04]|uniref:hypothetical protein n=1 Tax=Streptomyces sp. MZ04 TaxID=2559236 RepID=UPI00107EA906|nr:hypothetical protein [Streptomyces sp. MZ04]TGB03223.1 hypothetical protein E2651_25685 [Streptomyces sp. MZ04]
MSSKREEAMAALRAWSVPGTRARLLAEAWTAGETNVRSLAEAARCVRQTVYTDLKSAGIDPDDRPKEKNMTAVTVEGFNGVDDDQSEGLLYNAVVAKREGRPAPAAEEFGRMLALSLALGQYNELRARLAEEEDARAERNRARHRADTLWEALADPNNKGSWLHGHQAYVRAVDDAHRAIDAWKAVAETLMNLAFLRRGKDADRLVDAYEQSILPAGHPPVNKPDIDAEAEAARLHEALETEHARRKTLAAETLGLATRN